MSDDIVKTLSANLRHLGKAVAWLQRSLKKSEAITVEGSLDQDAFDTLENLASRFARASDILIQKVFRSIDTIELESSGGIIDVINRAAKRGFFSTDETAIRIRETRNAIAHEYLEEELVALFREVVTLSPLLLDAITRTETYCRNRGWLNF